MVTRSRLKKKGGRKKVSRLKKFNRDKFKGELNQMKIPDNWTYDSGVGSNGEFRRYYRDSAGSRAGFYGVSINPDEKGWSVHARWWSDRRGRSDTSALERFVSSKKEAKEKAVFWMEDFDKRMKKWGLD